MVCLGRGVTSFDDPEFFGDRWASAYTDLTGGPDPAAAVDWVLPPGCRRVADVGAGTGKLTRLLRARGLEVTAVEPTGGMREQLARRSGNGAAS